MDDRALTVHGMHGVDDLDDLDSMDLVVDVEGERVDLNELPWQKLPYQSFRDLLLQENAYRQYIDPPVFNALRVMQAHDTLPPQDTQCIENGFLVGRRQLALFNNNKHRIAKAVKAVKAVKEVLPKASQALVAKTFKHNDELWAARIAKRTACYKIISVLRQAKGKREKYEALKRIAKTTACYKIMYALKKAKRKREEYEAFKAALIEKEAAWKQKIKDAQTEKGNLRRLLHNIHTRQPGSALFNSNVEQLREKIAQDAALRKFSWMFCCRKMADVDRMFHAEHLSKWCWIVKFIADNAAAVEHNDDKITLRILEFFVQSRTECQSEPKSFKNIQRKIAKINQCLDWVHATFPEVATGYEDSCANMLMHACNHQPFFHQHALVLAHFLQRSEQCHDHVLEIILTAFKDNKQDAAAACSEWLLKFFPSFWPKLKLIADRMQPDATSTPSRLTYD